MRPLIGITSSFVLINNLPYNRTYAANAQAVAAAGGLPVYIPTHLESDNLRDLYQTLDGVLLPGGPDIDPAHYGQERHPKTVHIDAPRDALELMVARWAVADDVPVLGICRGHQVLNVAVGGTLVQDIPSEINTSIQHDIPSGLPRSTRIHDVSIDPNSRLASILGDTQVKVNSLHHQSVEKPAAGAIVTATAPDGVVEALELPHNAFALSVQWHPEDLYQDDAVMARLFEAFVEAARERRKQGERV